MNKTSAIDTIYILRLYVSGASPNSVRAISNIRSICEKYLKDNYELEIIDVYQQPEIAKSEQLIALPLLLKSQPNPVKRLIGNMADTDKVLRALNLV